MKEFDYKQRNWSREVSQSEWDAIFNKPATSSDSAAQPAIPGPEESRNRETSGHSPVDTYAAAYKIRRAR